MSELSERLRAHGANFDVEGLEGFAGACSEAADALDAAEEALSEARRVIQDDRDILVDCSTMPPEHDLATLDPYAKDDVALYDATLTKIDAALNNIRIMKGK